MAAIVNQPRTFQKRYMVRSSRRRRLPDAPQIGEEQATVDAWMIQLDVRREVSRPGKKDQVK
jgi:hypothetical protein